MKLLRLETTGWKTVRAGFWVAAAMLMAGVPQMMAQPYNQTAGTVVAWGNQVMPLVQAGTRFTRIAAGMARNVAVTEDGSVIAWGLNEGGESDVPSGLRNVIAIAAKHGHSLALESDGTVVA
jgi:hypothetical protein